ncbi:hypothetical protein [Parvularcula lutaonensis]|uniref:Peptidase M61 catalytic domain-containing protein n=1 Tax=Parvularcula lutaonensis TaxID=491923 RepID=A0ABV7MBT3_9PROT|nr:hypothetical protein [Parvularcula lutaonensis]
MIETFCRAIVAFALALSCTGMLHAKEPDAVATLAEARDGSFTVTFEFAEPRTVLVFGQSGGAYRTGAWKTQTPGARVETIGPFDVLTFERPTSSVTFAIEPFTENLPKAYTPFLDFSGSDWGVLTGQFRLLDAESREAIERSAGAPGQWQGEKLSMDVVISSPRPIYYAGQRYRGEVRMTPVGDGTYAYIGDARPTEGSSFIGFIDPGLPAWIAESFDRDLKMIFRELSDGWGTDLPRKAMILFAFKGYEKEGFSMTGGAFEGLLGLEIEGSALESADEEIRNYLLWFFSHEAAHLYQQNGEVQASDTIDAWMHEGSANTMAYALTSAISSDPDAFLLESYQNAWSTCLETLREGPLDEASLRGSFPGHYACGDFIALATDAILPRHDLYDFWNALKASAVEENDRRISAELYWETLSKLGGSQERIEDLRLLTTEGMNAPDLFLAGVLERAGLPPQLDVEGKPSGFTFRARSDRKGIHPR